MPMRARSDCASTCHDQTAARRRNSHNRIIAVTLDEESNSGIPAAGHQHERAIAIYDLVEKV